MNMCDSHERKIVCRLDSDKVQSHSLEDRERGRDREREREALYLQTDTLSETFLSQIAGCHHQRFRLMSGVRLKSLQTPQLLEDSNAGSSWTTPRETPSVNREQGRY